MSDSGVRSLKKISDLAEFLWSRDYTLIEIMPYLARVVFSEFNVLLISICQYNEKLGTLVNIGMSGAKSEDIETLETPVLISEDYPATAVFKSGNILCINTLPDWGSNYPHLSGLPLPSSSKSYCGIPLNAARIPKGILTLVSGDVIELDDVTETFLSTTANIFALHYYRNLQVSPNEEIIFEGLDRPFEIVDSKRGDELTERQLIILRLISEDRTNKSISQFLGYSESTIRQEVMRIFAKLGCTQRHEATQIFHSYSKEI